MKNPFGPGGMFGADMEMGHLTKKHKFYLEIVVALAALIQVACTAALTLKAFGLV